MFTSSEIERIAYITGQQALAQMAGEADQFEADIVSLEGSMPDQLDSAHEAGRLLGLGLDARAEIAELKAALLNAAKQEKTLREAINEIQVWFRNADELSTLVKRKTKASALREFMRANPQIFLTGCF